ncbi:MAG: class I SAM-dependent methyltransferase [Methylobacteriaceae bacterium]|nr:class I SAM-dependent methyltransferase [Methylobacteriaceae bacterium]
MSEASLKMDRMYRRQRRFYDLTRKRYLIGRDRLIERLDPPAGGRVLEIGCGTARNLVIAAARHPDCTFYGVDASTEMLKTAAANVAAHGLAGRIRLAQADVTRFDPRRSCGCDTFDRVVASYTLSMIEEWRAVVAAMVRLAGPAGSAHIVDFGGGAGLPVWFRAGLAAWLGLFDVTPRSDLAEAARAAAGGRPVEIEPLRGGYATHVVIGPAG